MASAQVEVKAMASTHLRAVLDGTAEPTTEEDSKEGSAGAMSLDNLVACSANGDGELEDLSAPPTREERLARDEMSRQAADIMARPDEPDVVTVSPPEADDESEDDSSAGNGGRRNYRHMNLAYREHSAALTDAGYQRTYTDPEKQYREDRLSCFWFDIVWDGFLDRRSENAIPAAQVRGCPIDVLMSEYERNEHLQKPGVFERLEQLRQGISPLTSGDVFPLWIRAVAGSGLG